MKIATFNINGIKARGQTLLHWLDEAQPDIALLQEIKSINEAFPAEVFEERGYIVQAHGQKSFNGVAILSKYPLEDVQYGLPGDPGDEQARWIEATVVGEVALRICCLYLPNGNPAPGPKFEYKMAWMDRLYDRAKALIASEEVAVMAGDYNIIAQPEDAKHPENWALDALFLPEAREKWRRIVNLGFYDAFRMRTPEAGHYSFWDYQRASWERDNGIRIDYMLLTPACADLLMDCQIDKHVRGWEKPSDHVPVWVELRI